MVVVVESHESGGSLITADAAIERGVEVRVVPGPVHSPASLGSNQLLYDGPGPVRHARDVLDGLGLLLPAPLPGGGAHGGGGAGGSGGAGGRGDPCRSLGAEARAVLDALGWRPQSINRIIERTGLAAPTACQRLDELEGLGLARVVGCWWSRAGPT